MVATLAAYLHDIDPFLIQFFPASAPWAGIRWYGLSYLVGFVIGYLLARRIAKVGISTLQPQQVMDLVVYVAVGVLVGGRVGYVLFYKPALLTEFTADLPFWGLLALNQGGMASHGGMIGVAIAAWLFARRYQHDWRHVADIVAFTAPLGLGFGRIANFINGELYGRACDPDFSLAVKFPQEMHSWLAHDPVKLEPLLPVFDSIAPGQPIQVQIAVAIDAIQQQNALVIAMVEPVLTPRHPSQLYLALLEGLAVCVLLLVLWRKPRKPLMIAGCFGIGYGLARIVGEFFRQPDEHIAHLEASMLGITRGQILSVLLLSAGVALVVVAQRSKAAAMGGWLRPTVQPSAHATK